MVDPSARAEYLCEIVEASGPNGPNGLPAFTITHEGDPSIVCRGRTAIEAWSALQSKRARLLHTRAPVLPPAKMHLEAGLFFGCVQWPLICF